MLRLSYNMNHKVDDQSRVYEAENDALKNLVLSTFTHEQIQSFQLRMKRHLDSEISTLNLSTTTGG